MRRPFNPELPDCYEYAKGDAVCVRTCCRPVKWEVGTVAEFHNSHGWEIHVVLPNDEYGPRTWRFDQACQVRPA